MRKIFPPSLMIMLILAVVLSGCGGGGSSANPNEQAIKTCFSSIGIDSNSFFRSSMFATSLHSARGAVFSWTTARFTDPGYTQSLTNITFDSETTAHATANFSVSASYSIGGNANDSMEATWSSSGTLSLSGSGTITFVKTDGVWSVDEIPDAIYLSNLTTSPTIESLSIPASAINGSEQTITGTITSHDTQSLDRFAIMTGFGRTDFSRINGSFSETITMPAGNTYGAITVIELAGTGATSSSSYYINACAYIDMIKISTAI